MPITDEKAEKIIVALTELQMGLGHLNEGHKELKQEIKDIKEALLNEEKVNIMVTTAINKNSESKGRLYSKVFAMVIGVVGLALGIIELTLR